MSISCMSKGKVYGSRIAGTRLVVPDGKRVLFRCVAPPALCEAGSTQNTALLAGYVEGLDHLSGRLIGRAIRELEGKPS